MKKTWRYIAIILISVVLFNMTVKREVTDNDLKIEIVDSFYDRVSSCVSLRVRFSNTSNRVLVIPNPKRFGVLASVVKEGEQQILTHLPIAVYVTDFDYFSIFPGFRPVKSMQIPIHLSEADPVRLVQLYCYSGGGGKIHILIFRKASHYNGLLSNTIRVEFRKQEAEGLKTEEKVGS